mgnify:CR=1 FL=1|jgi:hypothetical protein
MLRVFQARCNLIRELHVKLHKGLVELNRNWPFAATELKPKFQPIPRTGVYEIYSLVQ